MQLSVGDIVRLASGGPEMTVEGLPALEPTQVACVWFVHTDIKRETFPHPTLEKLIR